MILTLIAAASLATGCHAIDGDTLKCGPDRIRLLGIDAPETGKRPPRRNCAPGNPVASRNNLRRIIAGKALRIDRIKRDHYGRSVAVVHAGRVNLSCAQIAGKYAVYRRDWDDGYRIWRAC